MNSSHEFVNRTLNRAAVKWRGLMFLQSTGTIGAGVCVGLLALFAAILAGWLTVVWVAELIAFAVAGLGFLFWLSAIFVIRAQEIDSGWLAGVLERGQPQLSDRLNTLVALEFKRKQPEVAPFYDRILRQAQRIVFEKPPGIPINSKRALAHFAVFLVLLASTIWVYEKLSPWQRMLDAQQARLTPRHANVPPPAPSLELPPPADVAEQRQAWAEVRITEPARDLQLTKVDVVPLQIEAAANEPLRQVSWSSAINGQSEQMHPLPAPAEPRFAVFQPTLYLEELNLSDWDVLSYYAKADSQSTNSAASEVYFIEVRPFREDILKMPGGENGKTMQHINELSALISQQQHVIRQTHQHRQNPPDSSKVQEQDRMKLADAETDLSQATEHLYSRMADELENKPIGDALDHLAKAGKTLKRAAKSIRENWLPEGQEQERGALADLVATRKAFQKAVSENPSDFEEKPETPPSAAEQKDKLKEIAEFRDEAKAAEDFMRKLIEEQQSLGNTANQTSALARANLYPKLAAQEKKIESSLQEFQKQHPQVFKPVQPEAGAAEESLKTAAQSLEKKNPKTPSEVRDATRKLEELSQAMKEKSAEKQLADAYKLKKEIDRQIQNLGQCENPSAGGGLSDNQVKQAVSDTRNALKQLKTAVNQSPTKDAFGPEVREALSDINMVAMNSPLGEVEQAPTPEARKKPAGDAKEALEKVSKAFQQSEPKALQAAEKSAQKPPAGEFLRGVSQLSSLIKQLQTQHQLSRADQAKLGQEALYNLQQSVPEKGGLNEHGNQVLRPLVEELKKVDAPLDVEILQSVLESLQAFSVERSAKKDPSTEKAEMTDFDPSRLPSAYRGRIEKYFQKLSEK